MICQNCGKREANTHIKQIINGDMAESHLCSDCARHLGYSDMFSGFDLDLADFFGGRADNAQTATVREFDREHLLLDAAERLCRCRGRAARDARL